MRKSHLVNRLVLNSLLAAIGVWGAARDFCLIANGPTPSGIDLGQVALGVVIQVACLLTVGTSINREAGYFQVVWEWIGSPKWRAALWILPFAFFFLTHHMIANGLYKAGEIDKINIAARMSVALDRCCIFCIPGL